MDRRRVTISTLAAIARPATLAHRIGEANTLIVMVVDRDRQERIMLIRGRVRLAAASVGKEQSQDDLDTGNNRGNPAELVVCIVLVEVWGLVVIDKSEEDTESVEGQEEKLRWNREP